jgi:hypothetical protein
MITAELVRRRIANFWGYGGFAAAVWFVGMEEGLGPETELAARFSAADGKMTIDMRRDMAAVPQHMRWFHPAAPPIQQNWKYPIALYLNLKNGRPPLAEEVRAYQLDVLGDVDRKDSCVIELMPLPARSTGDADWRYLKFVGSRQQYLENISPRGSAS